MDKLFNKDLWGLVFEYTEPPVYSVRDWVLEGIKKNAAIGLYSAPNQKPSTCWNKI